MEAKIANMEKSLKVLESSFTKMEVNTKSMKIFSLLNNILNKVKEGKEDYNLLERFDDLTTELTERLHLIEKTNQLKNNNSNI